MKKITEDWFNSAESDLLLIKKIKESEAFFHFATVIFQAAKKSCK